MIRAASVLLLLLIAATATEIVTIQNCSCAACPVHTAQSGTDCVPDPQNVNHMRTITCHDHTQSCAQVIVFNDNQCTSFRTAVTVACGQCMRQDSGQYIIASCDLLTQVVTMQTNCNSDCSSCLGSVTQGFDVCSGGIEPNSWVFNQGIATCDAVSINIYSGGSCAGTPIASFWMGQYQCTQGEYMSCNPKDIPPAPPVPTNAQIIFSNCPPGSRGCINCFDFEVPSGDCRAPPPWFPSNIQSHQATCDTTESVCADLVVHNNTQCNFFQGLNTVVCGTCTQMGNQHWFTKVNCNASSQDVVLGINCNTDCSTCESTVTHPYLKCSAATFKQDYAIFNRGLLPCATVSITQYTSTDCSAGTSAGNFQRPQDVCNFDGRVQCTGRIVTVETCSCNTCPPVITGENSCTAGPVGLYYNEYLCLNQYSSCAQLMAFADTDCHFFIDGITAICGSCMKVTNPFDQNTHFFKVTCNLQTQSVTLEVGCNADCSSCPGGDTTHPYNGCSAAYVPGFSIFNQGISPCDAMQISMFASTTCSSAPAQQFTAAQHTCQFDEFITCSGDPLPPAPPGQEVIFSMCPPFRPGCINCWEVQISTGDCIPNIFGKPGFHQLNCDQMESYCADLTLHGGEQCGPPYLGNFHPVCGQCVQLPGQQDYVSIMCDQASQNLTISLQCDSMCMNCQKPNFIVHGYLQCSDLLIPGLTFFNRGVVPCPTISFSEFPDNSCTPHTQTNFYRMASGFCEFAHKFVCAAQAITVENCTCNKCNATILGENTCSPDPIIRGNSREITCNTQVQQCAQLIEFSDNQCKTFRDVLTAVCGTCSKRLLLNGTTIFMKFTCDDVSMTAYFDSQCNADCSVCRERHAATHPFNTCSNSFGGGTIFNQGIAPCDAVTINIFDTPTCLAQPNSTFTIGQHECSFGEYISCSAHPPEKPTIGGQIIVTECPHGHFGCVGCNVTTVGDGECRPTPNGAELLFCDPFPSTCADLVVHNNTQCAGFEGFHTPVCGSCQQWPGEQTYTRIWCNAENQSVTIHRNCEMFCTFCSVVETFNYLTCAPTTFHGQNHAIFNRGLISCGSVRVVQFSDPECDFRSQTAEFQVAQDICNMDHRFQCTPRIVTVENCSCATCAATYVPENQCAPDGLGMYRTYQCWMRSQLCVDFVHFDDAQCQVLTRGSASPFSAVCGACMKRYDGQGRPMFINVHCDFGTQAVRVFTKCDPLCLFCDQTTYVDYPFSQCSVDPIAGGSIYNQGFMPCDALEIQLFNNSACSGFAEMRYSVSQHQCTFTNEFFSCSTDPQPWTPPPGEIIFSHCPHSFGCINCQSFVVDNAQCVLPPPQFRDPRFASQMATCNTQESTCADIVVHNTSQCTAFFGIHNPVCGECTQFREETSWTLTTCDQNSQSITISRGCAVGCTGCTSSLTVPFMQCTAFDDQHGIHGLFNRGLIPCATVSMTQFTSDNCAPGTSIATFLQPQGVCNFDHKIMCTAHSVTVENCTSSAASINGEFRCDPDPYFKGHYRQLQCQNHVQNCAQLVSFADANCKQFRTVIPTVCGACLMRADPTTGLPTFSLATCNLNSQSVTFQTGCDPQCQACPGPSATHPFDACSKDAIGTGTIFNQGIAPCDAVTISVYQDPVCRGFPVDVFTRGQHQCMFDEYISCSGDPFPTANPANTLTYTDCPQGNSWCLGCTISSVASGACQQIPTRIGNSRQGVCNVYESVCVDLVMHNNSQCTDFIGLHFPVCGTCTIWPNQKTYTLLTCNQISQNVTVSQGCNSDCSTCQYPNQYTHGFLQCSAAIFGGMSFFNRGLQPCATVSVTEYSSNDCSGSSSAKFLVAQDVCQWDHRVQCLNTSSPPNGPSQGSSSSGTSAGEAVGITIGVIAAVAIAGFVVFKVKGNRAYRAATHIDEAPMNSAGATRSSYGYGT